ncbi:MAG: 50S ribosomal protein L31 [Gammaproteobacteria bacterium]
MQTDIHPNYDHVKVTCSCGNSFETRSTRTGKIDIEICSNCHPFYTGEQKMVDTMGRVDKFKKRYERATKSKSEAGVDAKTGR